MWLRRPRQWILLWDICTYWFMIPQSSQLCHSLAICFLCMTFMHKGKRDIQCKHLSKLKLDKYFSRVYNKRFHFKWWVWDLWSESSLTPLELLEGQIGCALLFQYHWDNCPGHPWAHSLFALSCWKSGKQTGKKLFRFVVKRILLN